MRAAPWRRVAQVSVGAGLVLVVATARVVVSGMREIQRARSLERRGLVSEAIVHYRRAARWYAPGAPHVGAALDSLDAIGRRAEVEADRPVALEAYRAVRGAILSTRSTYTPFVDRLRTADERIATLMADEPPAPADAQKSIEARRRMHAELLARDESVNVGWTLVMLAGFAAWMGGTVLFILRALGPDDRLRKRPALWWGACVVGGFLIWMLGLWRA